MPGATYVHLPARSTRLHLCQQAVSLGKPWVLDPVGCGATSYRTAACVAMLKLKPAVVRGNASEILALAGAAGGEEQPTVISQGSSGICSSRANRCIAAG